MAYVRKEEMRKIMIHIAQMQATGKQRRDMLNYLKESGVQNPTQKLDVIQQTEDYKKMLENAQGMNEALAATGAVETEDVTVQPVEKKTVRLEIGTYVRGTLADYDKFGGMVKIKAKDGHTVFIFDMQKLEEFADELEDVIMILKGAGK